MTHYFVQEDDNNSNTKIVQGSKRICDRRSLPLKASLPSDLWHSSVSLVTKEELSVSTRQTRDNKATKNRSMIVISLQGKGWRSTKICVGNFPRKLNFLLLYELQYQIVVQLGAQRKCLGEETLLSARGRKLLPHAGRAICAQGFPYLGLHMFTFNQTC